MSPRLYITALALLTAGSALHAQVMERRATMRGGSRLGSGKCTIEVVVDGAAQVEIRGDVATLRNLKGNPPQWRRFECDSIMPANAPNFRFQGIDGRGRQSLVRDPRQGGSAIVEIDDPDNGSEGYTFDILWSDNGGDYRSGGQYPPPQPGYGPGPAYGNGPRDRRFSADQAVQVCQDAIRDQARRQFRTDNISFRRTAMDDQPGRNDWVVGAVEARAPYGPPQVARFSCSVNFDTGRVRSAQLDPGRVEGGGPSGVPSSVTIQNCQRSVQDRLARDGYRRPVFGSVRYDDAPGRNDWIVGDVRADGRYGQEDLRFSCQADGRDGDIRNVDITTRR